MFLAHLLNQSPTLDFFLDLNDLRFGESGLLHSRFSLLRSLRNKENSIYECHYSMGGLQTTCSSIILDSIPLRQSRANASDKIKEVNLHNYPLLGPVG